MTLTLTLALARHPAIVLHSLVDIQLVLAVRQGDVGLGVQQRHKGKRKRIRPARGKKNRSNVKACGSRVKVSDVKWNAMRDEGKRETENQ